MCIVVADLLSHAPGGNSFINQGTVLHTLLPLVLVAFSLADPTHFQDY